MKTVLILLLLLVPSISFAQPSIFDQLRVEDGLSNNYVVDITQDNQGFMWIATESGLNRFDGSEFTTFKTNNSNLVGNELNTLYFDRAENELWVGTQRNGISIFDYTTENFTNLTINNGLATNDVTHLSPAPNGIWITHYHVGVGLYNHATQQIDYYTEENVPGLKVRNWCAMDNQQGELYIGHAFDGLSILNVNTHEVKNYMHDANDSYSIPGNTVRAILQDSKQRIWIGTNNGLALFNPQTEQFTTFKHHPHHPHSLLTNTILCLQEMNGKELWIGCDTGGVSILNLSTQNLTEESATFTQLFPTGTKLGLSSPNVRALFQDSFQNIWIGNYRNGIDFLPHTPKLFQTLVHTEERTNEPTNKQVWGICQDSQGAIWLGGENELSKFEKNCLQQIIPIHPSSNKAYTQINTIKESKEGILWLGMYNSGVTRFNPSTNQIVGESLCPNLTVNTFYQEEEGKMWIGTQVGIYTYQQGILTKEEKINQQLPDEMVYAILRDKEGKLWIGTFGKGISIFENEQLTTNLVTEGGFCSNAIQTLYLDSKGSIWAATRNGLALFRDSQTPTKYEIYNDKEGLADNHIRAIQEDTKGSIWVSTNSGLSMWNEKEEHFTNYNHQNGVPTGNFMNQSAAIGADGVLYFGSQNGVCYFDPLILTQAAPNPEVQITQCLAFSRRSNAKEESLTLTDFTKKIELPHYFNSLRFLFTTADYAQSQQIEYAYNIKEFDDLWHDTQGDRQVTLRGLSPGTYTFQVKGRLYNQDWKDAEVATVQLTILPPIWLAWYAKLIYTLLLVWLILLIARFYKKRLQLESSLQLERKRNQQEQELHDEKLSFYTFIAHELRTPLTLILGPLEDLLADEKLDTIYGKKIGVIHRSSLQLLNLINQILDLRKIENPTHKLAVERDDLGLFLKQIGAEFSELNSNQQVQLQVSIEQPNHILYFDKDALRLIMNNLLSNAFKYTAEGTITITLQESTQPEKGIEIVVSDTGSGISAEALPRIFDCYYQEKGEKSAPGFGIGLALVKSLVTLHQGELHVTSELGKGTSFTITLQRENNYPQALHKESLQRLSTETVAESSVIAPEESSERPLLLIVEDNLEIQNYIKESLESDYQIMTAHNGEEGLRKAQENLPHIIVSDIMMPIMDGIKFCKEIKENICTSHIPIVLLTAKDTLKDKEEGYESGADSYITKPFSANLLQTRLRNILARQKKMAEEFKKVAMQQNELTREEEEKKPQLSRLDNEFLEKVTQIVKENIDMEKMDVAFIADKMHMSHSTLYRKTKSLTDMSINEFIRKIKIKHSATLIREEGYNVTQAAFMTGFYNRSYFRQCFKDEFGVTPSEYGKGA